MSASIGECIAHRPLILTEGAVGLRMEREYGFAPDPDIAFAALIYQNDARQCLEHIYRQYLSIAQDYDLPILLLTNTRRANRQRMERSAFQERNVMLDYAAFLSDIAMQYPCESYIGGMMGCKGDAYSGRGGLCREAAAAFHSWQASLFRDTPVDFLFAAIMPSLEEIIGMAQAMAATGKPYIISLMMNRDGNILDGHSIHAAIEDVDRTVHPRPLCYMTNCVHPDILRQALAAPYNRTALVKERFLGIQANASALRANELDHSVHLHSTDARTLIGAFEALRAEFPMRILGGCCGTDQTHIKEIAQRFRERSDKIKEKNPCPPNA